MSAREDSAGCIESCESKLHSAFGMDGVIVAVAATAAAAVAVAIFDCVSSDCESVGVTTLRPQLDAGDR